jgi:hypothetical protein
MSCIRPPPKDIFPRRGLNTATKVQLFSESTKFAKQNFCFLVGISQIGQIRQIGGKISLKGILKV